MSAVRRTGFFPPAFAWDAIAFHNYANNNPDAKNACHRSSKTWSRQATMPDWQNSIGKHADVFSERLDYKLIACSGARVHNILDSGQYHELAQLEQGYLDNHTTLVTISIGGNDARFTGIFKECVYGSGIEPRQDGTIEGDDRPLKEYIPDLIESEVRPKIVDALTAIQREAPNAKIMLMGYPVLPGDSADCLPIGAGEAPWLNNISSLLLTQMHAAVADANSAGVNVWFSNPANYFVGKGVCGDPATIHAIVLDKLRADNTAIILPSTQSLHPKISGTELLSRSFMETMNDMNL